jgi:hypothetical protein
VVDKVDRAIAEFGDLVPLTGEFADAKVIRSFGDVPDDLSAM